MGRYDIDGRFLATDGDLLIDAELRFSDARIEVTEADGSPVAVTTKIEAVHPAAIRYVDAVAQELHRIAHRRSSPRAVPKPSIAAPRRKKTQAVPCPACFGVEPQVWDCGTCDGGGVVPG